MKLSIIICTYNRSYAIVDCLESVRKALDHVAPIEAEIVVVNNNSTDDTAEIVNDWARTCPTPLTLSFEPRKGLAIARNCGIRAASGDILVFTDDDCRLTVDYLSDALRYIASDAGPVLRGGAVLLGDPLDLPLTIKIDGSAAVYSHPMHPAGFILGANMVMQRQVVDVVGMFDERFGSGTPFPGEDCDYIIRANAAGVPVHYVPDMAVLHFHGRRDPKDAQKLFAGYMRANGALYIKHLRTSPLLMRQFFWDAKWWLKEIVTGKRFFDEPGLKRRDITLNNISGMFRFSIQEVRRRFSARATP